jgi:SAM-dependent methyltransferase
VSGSYAQRVAQQIQQYRAPQDVHALPDIYHYWSDRYLRPRFLEVLGVDGVEAFFAQAFAEVLVPGREARFLSVGCGDCSVEIGVAREVLRRAPGARFVLECIDLSPVLLERGLAAVRAAGLARHLALAVEDVNAWRPARRYDAVMANHSLHHVVALEALFDGIRSALVPGGRFVVNDMIGRNGHMRWPEALAYVEQLWAWLPPSKKYDHQLRTLHERFPNFDCSREGFEGIRAQDILPLLVERFAFRRFLAFGGVLDPFIDRSYGHNFDPRDPRDAAFIDGVEELGSHLLDRGEVKPTQVLAELQLEPCLPRVWRHWTPRHALRDPGAPRR